jgi:hypothetical protein
VRGEDRGVDRDRALSASWDDTLRLWDLTTGATLRVLEGHSDRVTPVVALDLDRALSASWVGTCACAENITNAILASGVTVDHQAAAVRQHDMEIARRIHIIHARLGDTRRQRPGRQDGDGAGHRGRSPGGAGRNDVVTSGVTARRPARR